MNVDPGRELYAKSAAYSHAAVLDISDGMLGGFIWPFWI
jgi:hypothetical protein